METANEEKRIAQRRGHVLQQALILNRKYKM